MMRFALLDDRSGRTRGAVPGRTTAVRRPAGRRGAAPQPRLSPHWVRAGTGANSTHERHRWWGGSSRCGSLDTALGVSPGRSTPTGYRVHRRMTRLAIGIDPLPAGGQEQSWPSSATRATTDQQVAMCRRLGLALRYDHLAQTLTVEGRLGDIIVRLM